MPKKRQNIASLPVIHPRQCHKQEFGVTLIEMLTTIAVVSIFFYAGIPWISGCTHSLRLSSQINSYLSALQLARSEAIKRNSVVTVCKSSDGLHCSEAGGWQQGWIVFNDLDHNAIRADSELIIHRSPALPAGIQLTGNSNVAKYISFAPTGATRMTSGAFQAGTLTLCRKSSSTGEARKIVISGAGRLRTQRDQASPCT